MGDECHNRNRAGTSLFLRALGPRLIESPHPHSHTADCFRFITGNDHFFLNLMMPAAKVAADLARDVPGSTMVVAMARNGTEFGIRLSGTGDAWFTGPASVPEGSSVRRLRTRGRQPRHRRFDDHRDGRRRRHGYGGGAGDRHLRRR